MNTSTTSVRPQTMTGVVVKAAGKDTAVVRVDRYVKHPKYKKFQVRSKKYLVDDPGNTAPLGATVVIAATRPISKLKRFKLSSITKTVAPAEEE